MQQHGRRAHAVPAFVLYLSAEQAFQLFIYFKQINGTEGDCLRGALWVMLHLQSVSLWKDPWFQEEA